MEDYRPAKCRECGRPLKAKVSVARGFGPTCGAKWAEKWIKVRPKYLGEKAKKVWTKDEIKDLMEKAGGAR